MDLFNLDYVPPHNFPTCNSVVLVDVKCYREKNIAFFYLDSPEEKKSLDFLKRKKTHKPCFYTERKKGKIVATAYDKKAFLIDIFFHTEFKKKDTKRKVKKGEEKEESFLWESKVRGAGNEEKIMLYGLC